MIKKKTKKKKELRARGKCNTFLFSFSLRHSSSSWKNSLRLSALSLALALTSCLLARGFRWPPVDGVLYSRRCRRACGHPKLCLAHSRTRSYLRVVSVFLARAHARSERLKLFGFFAFLCFALSLFVLLNLYLYFIFTKIYTNRLRIVINFN